MDPGRTIGEVRTYLSGGKSWDDLAGWPPDVFAVTGVLIQQSGAFRLAVSPEDGKHWPPPFDSSGAAPSAGRWQSRVEAWARVWVEVADISPGASGIALPDRIARLVGTLSEHDETAVHDICGDWDLACALLQLHVLADQTAAGLSRPPADDLYTTTLGMQLTEEGTVSRLPVDRIRVMPKRRTPTGGMTVRSLSRYLAFLNADMETTWITLPGQSPIDRRISRVLVIPWPAAIAPTDFVELDQSATPLKNMDESRYGFFSFEPQARINARAVAGLVDRASKQVGGVDAVVFPEAALLETELEEIENALAGKGVSFLLTGLRQPPGDGQLGKNRVHVSVAAAGLPGQSGSSWKPYDLDKHHRWCLDAEQIQQYHLGARLHPARRWWEAIAIPERTRIFLRATDNLTICPVICEDLARIDPAADSVHAVGPELVVALLLDGPQLDSRWPARYASVLADDPGSSVLCVTSLGMALRSRPAGKEISRTVALWKDRKHGVREIELDRDHDAVLLTLCIEMTEGVTADGRSDGETTAEPVLAGIEQILCPEGVKLALSDADIEANKIPERLPDPTVADLEAALHQPTAEVQS